MSEKVVKSKEKPIKTDRLPKKPNVLDQQSSSRKITVIPATEFKMIVKNPGGRPTKYRPIYCKWVVAYFEDANPVVAIVDDPGGKGGTQTKLETVRVPTLRGFAAKIGIGKSTLYDWANMFPAFREALSKAQALEYGIIEELGMAGRLGKGVAELYFMNHLGYKDSRRLDITSDGKALPTPITALQLNINTPGAQPKLLDDESNVIDG